MDLLPHFCICSRLVQSASYCQTKAQDQRSVSGFSSLDSMGSEFNTFLGLPELARTKIYEKTLGVPHPVYLYLGPGSSVQTFAPDAPSQWLALLRTNRRVSAEASQVFYRVNHFELLDINRQQITVLQPFLDHIGPANAASISYLCVSFPTMVDTDTDTPPPPAKGGMEWNSAARTCKSWSFWKANAQALRHWKQLSIIGMPGSLKRHTRSNRTPLRRSTGA